MLNLQVRGGDGDDAGMATDAQIANVTSQAQSLKGTPYELLYTSAPTPATIRFAFHHTTATTVDEALSVIAAAKVKLLDGTAAWTSGEPFTP